MKSKVILAMIVLMLNSVSFASFPPTYSCTNSGGTIMMNNGKVSILVSMYPSATYENFDQYDVKVIEQVLQELPKEKLGCTTRTITFVLTKINKIDGTPMPDAYNKLAQDGNLTDYFICTESLSWLPQPGQACQ